MLRSPPRPRSSAGNTRGLIEAHTIGTLSSGNDWSSAGNTRGLIEAGYSRCPVVDTAVRLPRGIPAASLKQYKTSCPSCKRKIRLPRGIPAASLKPRTGAGAGGGGFRLPRGIPAASLKHRGSQRHAYRSRVFRGEYPRPH